MGRICNYIYDEHLSSVFSLLAYQQAIKLPLNKIKGVASLYFLDGGVISLRHECE